MNLFKRIFVLALVAMVMVACNKDREFATEKSDDIKQTETTVFSESTTLKRSCASHSHTEKLLQNDDYRQAYEARKAKFSQQLKTNVAESRALCSSPKVLPVAVHYQGVNNPNKACLVSLAQNQVNIINADIQGRNADISQWNNNASSTFPGVSNGEACIEFCLATKNHPSGFGLSDGDLAVTINQTNGDQSSAWSGYINIFVNDADGALGYSPLGGSGNGDGVVINRDAFGSGSGCTGVSPQSPYDLGRTLTHELGHYLNLDHIWGNGCNQDDGIADTPDQGSDNAGCPNIGASSCGSADLHMNYMDYTNDACMYMFTAGQANVMESWMNANLNLKSASEVCGEANGGGDNGGGDNDGGDNGGGDNGDGDNGDVCTAPTASSVTQINDTDIRVDWEDITDAIRYQIQYRPQGGSWIRRTVTNSARRINGLTPGTTYQYRLRTRCADGTWTSYSGIESYTLPGGDNGGGDDNGGDDNGGTSRVTIKVTLDDFGSETTFAIEDGNYNVIKSWGPFSDGQAGSTKTRNIDLPTGVYTFVIYDDYGDGICCDFGEGSWTVAVDGQNIASSDGVFGQWEEFDFAIGGARLSGPASRKDTKDYSKLINTDKYKNLSQLKK